MGVSLRMVKPENTPFWPTPWVSSSLLLLSTRWTQLSHHTARLDLKKFRRKSLASSRRLDTTQLLSLLSQSLDGMETTCCRPAPTCPGTRDGMLSVRKERPAVLPYWKLLMPLFPLPDPLTSPSDCLFRMFTKLEVWNSPCRSCRDWCSQ